MPLEDGARGLRCVVGSGRPPGNALPQRARGSDAVENRETGGVCRRDLGESVALGAAQEGCVDDDVETIAYRRRRDLPQAPVGRRARVGGVEPAADGRSRSGVRVEAGLPLALEVRAHAQCGQPRDELARDVGLAAAGQSVCDQKERAARRDELARDLEVRFERARLRLLRLLARFDRNHLCSNHGAVGEVEAQHFDAGIVAARFEILRDECVCEVGTVMCKEVHHREAGFARHVDLAQARIEFQGIERDDLAVQQQQVLQVQVAVAVLACIAREPGCYG